MKTKRKSKLIALFSMLAMVLVGAGVSVINTKGSSIVEADETTISVADYASANSWSNGTKYPTIVSGPFTLTGSGGTNSTKYYAASPGTWRFYSSDSPKGNIVITSDSTVQAITAVSTTGAATTWTINGKTATMGDISANISISGFTITYTPVGVTFGTLDKIEVNSAAAKTYFYVGDPFDSEGLAVTATDTAGTKKLVDNYTTTYDGVTFDESYLGDQDVTVSYTENEIEKDATYSITVSVLKVYKKITSVAELHIGSTYTIVGIKTGVPYVMSTTQNSSNRVAVPTIFIGGDIKETFDTQKIELVAGTKSNTYGLKTINGPTAGKYLKASSSSSNNLISEDSISDDSSWLLTFAGGVLSAVAQGTNTRNQLKLNSDSDLFAAYGSGQVDIAFYADESTLPAPALVTSFTVEPEIDGPIFTTSALESSDFTVTIVKDGNPGSSNDYTVEIGKLEGAIFTFRSTVEWGVTKPVLADNVIRFKSIHPKTAGGSDHLTVDIAISVLEPSLSSISITGSMTKTNYYTTDAWSALGLTVTALFDNGDELNVTNNVTWSYNPENPNNVSTTSVAVTATYQGEEDSKTISGIIITEKPMTPLVISEAYGGGGNSGAPFTHDFVELYNNTDSAITLNGLSIQQASASGTSWSVEELSGSILAKSYYLVSLASGSTGAALPTADEVGGNINLSGTAFKIALVDGTTTLTGTQSTLSENVLDFVGSDTANAYEGDGAAPKPSNSKSVSRAIVNGIAVDTDNNANDFTVTNPNPMNSALSVAEKIMAYSSEPGTTAECAEKYSTIKPLVLSLSAEQLIYFKEGTVDLMANARARYESWAAANRDSTPYVDGSSGGNVNFFNNKNSIITFVILISILGVSTLAGYYFIRKRPKVEETN